MEELITANLDIWSAAVTAKASGAGRSSGNKGAYGINKLRELILELAVRGKLVPQDPKDEPASQLLKRIQKKKEQLIATATIKKDKDVLPITEAELPLSLPVGWAYSRLGSVVEIVRGITFPGSEKSKTPERGRIACLRTSNVQDQIEWSDILYIGEKYISRDDQILKPQDIVMSMANSRELVGKVALVGDEIKEKTTFGGFLGVLRPFLIEPRFVMALLRTPSTRDALIDSASQTTNIANISLAKLRPLCFAIPSLAEQHRIVAKMDELMALCDQLETEQAGSAEAHEKLVRILLDALTQGDNCSESWARLQEHFDVLFTTPASIDKLKQTLLQLAVMGKLVPQDPNDEPGSKLQEKILAEQKKKTAEGKIRNRSVFVDFHGLEEIRVEIPPSWTWMRLGEIADIVRGGSPRPAGDAKYYDGTIPFLKVGDVTRTTGKMVEGYTYTIKEAGLSKTRLIDERTVLLTNSGATLGVPAICDFKTTFNDGIAAFIFLNEMIYDEFLFLYLKAKSTWFLNVAAQGQGQPNLNTDIIRATWFPVASLKEQYRIVTKVDELMALCNQVKAQLVESGEQQRKLADVMVERAVTRELM